MSNKLTIGLFGFGCVGSGLYEVLNQSKLLNATIKHIVVKDPTKKRTLPTDRFSYDKQDILTDPSVNLVVELIDDAEAAYQIVTQAIRAGKNVISANKKLIANHLEELIQLKTQYGVSFLYEAAVCGSIPIIRNLEEYYNNDSLAGIEGICNGTTNYILTRLANENSSFETVLADAQDAGFAETDPTMDIDGFDSKFKLQILLLHSFGILTTPDDILNIGIRHIKEEDIILAKEKGLKIKLISFARKIENKVVAFVAPVLVNKSSFAYDINYEFNSVSIEALFSDKQVFIGKGAGSFPTASAVLSDISALQYGYNYEYKKLFNSNVELAEDFEVSVFISANSVHSLDKIKFNSVEEEYTSSQFVYKIGRLNRFSLNHAIYRENPDLFIAFIPDANLTLKTGKKEKKVVELIN